MVFKKMKRSSLVVHVTAQIEKAIIDGVFQTGEKLPPMDELQEMLGASRGTLREAFRILEQKGLIEIRLGTKGGIFVRESTIEPLSQGLDLLIRQQKISLDDLAQFRKVIEAGLMHIIAKKLTKTHLEKIKRYLEEFEAQVKKGADGWGGFLEVEVRLRKTLIRIAGNQMFEVVLVPIHENIFAYAQHLPGEEAVVEDAYGSWRQIIDALEKKDAEKAASLTRAHIDQYAQRIKRSQAKAALNSSKDLQRIA